MRSKLIAAGIGIFGYGALLGWAITGDKFDAKMKSNQRLLGDIISKQSSELSAAKNMLLQTMDPNSFEDLDSIIEEVQTDGYNWLENHREEAGVITPDPDPVPGASWQNETPEETRSNLQSLIDKYNANDEDREAFEYMVNKTIEDSGPDNTPPFVISRETYSWDEEGEDYAKLAVTYYPQDRVLLDDDQEVVDHKDIDTMVGWKNLQRFGDESDDANVVFVRCRRLLTDFEIYQETEGSLPAHVRYGMDRHEFETHQAVGITRFRRDDV